ncbi:MAG TPA: Xaa-Pro peptidase family protein [Thermoleophilia bacterium]|nr:Xaa-Pro peptidase family protein [Thermoleophilia bacterium]
MEITAGAMTKSEYEARWRRAQEECKKRGLDALVVWSRGGGAVDSYADVLYLANHSSPFPLIGDLPGHWSGRAHSAVVLPTNHEPVLVVDMPDWRRDLVVTDEVRFALDLPREVAQVLREHSLSDGRLGLVAGNAMLVSPYRSLLDAVPEATFVPADVLLEELRAHKSDAELEMLREAAEVGNAVVAAMIDKALIPGATEAEAVAAGWALAVSSGVAPYDACVASGPHSDCYAYGRLPSWTTRSLEEGDFFHVDTYGALSGYLYDFARCCVVGGKPTSEQREVLEAVVGAVEAGVQAIGPGVRACDVFQAVHSVLEDRGMVPDEGESTQVVSALTTSFPAHGHSFGLAWERPWLVADNEDVLEANMCFGIEAMAGRAGVGSVKFEENVLLTRDGVEVLTVIPVAYW